MNGTDIVEATDSQQTPAAVFAMIVAVLVSGLIALLEIVQGEPATTGRRYVWIVSIGTSVLLALYALLLDRNPGLTDERVLTSSLRDLNLRRVPGAGPPWRLCICLIGAYMWSFAWLGTFYVALDRNAMAGLLVWCSGPVSVLAWWRWFDLGTGEREPRLRLIDGWVPQVLLAGCWIVSILATARYETSLRTFVLATLSGGAFVTNSLFRAPAKRGL